MEAPRHTASIALDMQLAEELQALIEGARSLAADVREHGSQISESVVDLADTPTVQDEMLRYLRLQHLRRLRELGVSSEQLASLSMSGLDALTQDAVSLPLFRRIAAPLANKLRVMQWNILSTRRDLDYIVSDVLKVGHGDPASAQRSMRNLLAVTDWEARYAKMRIIILMLQPDIIALQEVSRMREMQRDMRSLGYECSLDSTIEAVDARHMPSYNGDGHLNHLRPTRVAFAHRDPSVAGLACDALDAEDSGVASFWRPQRLHAERLDVSLLPRSPPASESASSGSFEPVLRARLTRCSDGMPVTVVCAQLASGGLSMHEAERVLQVTGQGGATSQASPLHPWLSDSNSGAVVLCMDGNSAPDRAVIKGEPATVWSSIRSEPGVHSVWDGFFAQDGARLHAGKVATTNTICGQLARRETGAVRILAL